MSKRCRFERWCDRKQGIFPFRNIFHRERVLPIRGSGKSEDHFVQTTYSRAARRPYSRSSFTTSASSSGGIPGLTRTFSAERHPKMDTMEA